MCVPQEADAQGTKPPATAPRAGADERQGSRPAPQSALVLPADEVAETAACSRLRVAVQLVSKEDSATLVCKGWLQSVRLADMSAALLPPPAPETHPGQGGRSSVACVPVGVPCAAKMQGTLSGDRPDLGGSRVGISKAVLANSDARARVRRTPMMDTWEQPAPRGARSGVRKPKLWAGARPDACAVKRAHGSVQGGGAEDWPGAGKRRPWCCSTKVDSPDAATVARERERQRQLEGGYHIPREGCSQSPIQRKRKEWRVSRARAVTPMPDLEARKERGLSQETRPGQQGEDRSKKRCLSKPVAQSSVNTDTEKRHGPGAERQGTGRAEKVPTRRATCAAAGAANNPPNKGPAQAEKQHQLTPHRPASGTPSRGAGRSARPTDERITTRQSLYGQTPPPLKPRVNTAVSAAEGTPASAKSIYSDSEEEEEDAGAAQGPRHQVGEMRAAAATPPQIQAARTRGMIGGGSAGLSSKNFASILDDEDGSAEAAAGADNTAATIDDTAATRTEREGPLGEHTAAVLARDEMAQRAASEEVTQDGRWVTFGSDDRGGEADAGVLPSQPRPSDSAPQTSSGGEAVGGGIDSEEEHAQEGGSRTTVKRSYDAVVEQLAGVSREAF